ncbi:hypothetical protein [Hyalangium minutum]|nr:hypothetical protein [Hyalangium minutum]
MNHPQSRWLRMRTLLLLAPLLVAATPSPQLLPLSDWKLGFDGPPLEIKQNECIAVTVQTQTLAGMGVNLGYAVNVSLGQNQPLGTFHDLPGCLQAPITETLIPFGSIGKRVYYKASTLGRVMLIATDGVLGLNPGASRPISVVIGYTARLEFTAVPTTLRPGNTAQVKVKAYDEFNNKAVGYAGRFILSSNLSIPELPLESNFEPLRDNGERTFTLTFPAPGNYQLTIQDVAQANLNAQSSTLPVLYPKVSVVPTRKLVGTCESTTFTLQVVNDQGQPSPEPATVRLCRPVGSAVSLVPTQAGDTRDSDCAVRILQGSAQSVTWISTDDVDVPFVLHEGEPVGDLTITWKRLPSPQHSSLSYVGKLYPEPTLTSYIDQLLLQFELKDTCNQPLAPSEKLFSFTADQPLFVGPVSQPSPGVWKASVALAGCPADLSQRLVVRPAFDGTPILGELFELHIQPKCSDPLVELSLRSKEDSALAKPGAQVEFEVKLENKSSEPVPQGVLDLSTEGLTKVKAEVDGTPLTLQDNAAELPLEPGKTLTVRITAQASAQQDQSMRLTALYTRENGIPLTPEKSVTLHVGDRDVNVGCGSQPATLPGHLVSWLVLLLAASRPWERSRRLRQRERIDRQAPW